MLASLVAAFALPHVAFAQLDDYAVTPVTAPTLKLEHSVLIVQDGNALKAFSGLTRKWSTVFGAFGTPTYTLSNEHCIVRDGPLFYGFSTRSSTFAPLFPLSGQAQLMTNGSAQSWQSVVLDGNTVHLYSAITGQWHSHTFAATPTVNTSGRLCVLVDDGTTVWGMSPYYGGAVPLNVAGAAILGGFGNSGIASSAGEIHGFSAHLNRWTSDAVAAPPAVFNTFTSQPGYVAITDGASIKFYSGQTGTFTTLPAPPTASITTGRFCAAVVDGSTAYAYSGLRGDFASVTLAAPPTVTVSHFFAIFDDGSNGYAYSADKNAFAAPLPGPSSYFVTQTSAAATPIAGSSATAVYSALSNQWFGVPVLATSTMASANGIVLIDPSSGSWGFSPNTDTWQNLAIAPPDAFYQATTPQGPSLLVLRTGQDLHTFNHRSGEWRSITAAAPILTTKNHWGAAVLQDGVNAYAFGVFNDRWSTMPISGAAVVNAQVESASVFDGSQVYGYTAFGQLVSSADYPEYFRAIGVGGRMRLDLAGEANSLAILVLGFAPASIPTGFGTLLIDPTNLILFAQLPLSAAGQLDLTLAVPESPAYSGLDAHFQAALLGPNGLYLTNSVIARIR